MSAPIPGFAEHTAVVNGIRLAFRIGGPPDGPPVLLWHGFLTTSYGWRKVAPLFAERGCAVLVPDMCGFGDSEKPPGQGHYDGLALANDMRALVRTTNFGRGRPLLVVAHDMGAPPALLWAAHWPDELAGLAYLEEPVLLPDVLSETIRYTEANSRLGGLWWWLMALAPGIPEALIAGGNERAFLEWFYRTYAAVPDAVEAGAVDEVLRTFSGAAGVAGAFGVYRAVPETARQTAPLAAAKVRVPVLALGGEHSQGAGVLQMVQRVASDADGGSLPGAAHFLPEEVPAALVARLAQRFASHLA